MLSKKKKKKTHLTLILRNKSYWKRGLTTRTNMARSLGQTEFHKCSKIEKYNLIFVET